MMTAAEWIWKGTNHLGNQYSRKCHQTHQKALHIASGQWPKTPCQFSQGVYKGKDMESLRLPKSISRFKSDWTWISPAEEETKGRNSPKQATVGIGCIKVKGWGNYFKGWDQESGDVYGSQTHCCDCTQGICNKVHLSQYLWSHQIVGWTLKLLSFLFGKTCMLKQLIIKCDIL